MHVDGASRGGVGQAGVGAAVGAGGLALADGSGGLAVVSDGAAVPAEAAGGWDEVIGRVKEALREWVAGVGRRRSCRSERSGS